MAKQKTRKGGVGWNGEMQPGRGLVDLAAVGQCQQSGRKFRGPEGPQHTDVAHAEPGRLRGGDTLYAGLWRPPDHTRRQVSSGSGGSRCHSIGRVRGRTKGLEGRHQGKLSAADGLPDGHTRPAPPRGLILARKPLCRQAHTPSKPPPPFCLGWP